MKTVMGIDSGGSKTICLLARENGEIIARGLGIGAATVTENGGKNNSTREAILATLADSGLQDEIDSIFVSLGGLNTEETARISRELTGCGNCRVERESGGTVVFSSAKWWGFDVAVMAGTGTVALGTDSKGKNVSIGGWGHIIDDRGSGYSIGRNALQMVSESIELRCPATLLASAILSSSIFEKDAKIREILSTPQKQWSDSSRLMVKEFFKRHLKILNRPNIASLAPVVTETCANGDKSACEIIERAALDLGELASAVVQQLNPSSSQMTVTGIGGVFKAGELIWEPFQQASKKLIPNAEIIKTDFDLAQGAVLMALKQADVEINPDIIKNIKKSYRKIII